MEVHQAGVGLPSCDRPTHSDVVQRPRTPKPSCKPLLRTDIVTWEDVQASEASEEHVLGGPPADAAQFSQSSSDHLVVFPRQQLEIQLLLGDRARKGKKRASFLAAESDRSVSLRGHARHI